MPVGSCGNDSWDMMDGTYLELSHRLAPVCCCCGLCCGSCCCCCCWGAARRGKGVPSCMVGAAGEAASLIRLLSCWTGLAASRCFTDELQPQKKLSLLCDSLAQCSTGWSLFLALLLFPRIDSSKQHTTGGSNGAGWRLGRPKQKGTPVECLLLQGIDDCKCTCSRLNEPESERGAGRPAQMPWILVNENIRQTRESSQLSNMM